MIKNCKIHGNVEHSKRPDSNGYRCRKCMVDSVSKRRRKLKQLAIDYKGGECEKCGYNKCNDALEFHHLDPNEKDFGIGNGNIKSWERVKKELSKCIMVCANCHREIHSGEGA